MKNFYDFETKMLRKPLRKTSQNGDHCTVKTLKNAKSHWLPLLLTVALSLLMGQPWAQTTPHKATFNNNNQWTVPANAGQIVIECIGGGAGGGTTTTNQTARGGGGGGGYAKSVYDINASSIVQPLDDLSVSIGAGGAAGVAGSNSEVKKGNTVLARGGGGATTTTTTGGAGGSDNYSNVDFKANGGQGGDGKNASGIGWSCYVGGGGGGAAGPFANGVSGNSPYSGGTGAQGTGQTGSASGGAGGVGHADNNNTGNGGQGSSCYNGSFSGSDTDAGDTGNKYGGGGGGASRNSNTATASAGAGAAGFVQITYFIKHTITLNANGGTLIGESTIGVWEDEAYGSALNANVPFYQGHTFDGWFTAETGGTEVTSANVPAGNTTLYAHWTEGTAPISLADQVTFPSSTTWTAPEGTWKITSIEAWGGGGGGGGAYRQYSNRQYYYYYGGGGGSGAYAKNNILTPQNFHSIPFSITVGAGGAGNSGAAGGNGTNSSLSYNGQIYVNAGGGTGGAVSSSINNTGGAGGEATTGTTKTNGGNGANRTNSNGGKGGDAPNGGTGGAGSNNNSIGTAGNAPGGGGGGSFCSSNYSQTKAGGAGAAGQVKIAYEILRLNVRLVDNYEGGNSKDTIILYYDTINYTPVREGYEFLGWYNQAEGGAKFDFPASGDYLLYNLTEDTTLYAHWLFPGAISSTSQTLRPCVADGIVISSASEPDPSPFTYQWRYSYNGADEVVVSGAIGKDLTMDVPSTVGTYVYKRYVSIDGGTSWYQSANSCTVTVVERNAGKISLASGAEIFPCDSYNINNSVAADDVATYQWCYVDAQGEHTVAEATGSSLTNAPNFTEPGTYKFTRYISSTCGGHLPSDTVTVTVNPIPGGTITADPTNIAPRHTYTITGSDEGAQFTYHWAYKKTGESNYTDIPGATGKDLSNAPVLSALGNYEFIRYTDITSCNCVSGTATTSITVALESHPVCFETPGEQTWTAPEGTWKITNIEAWGGGGAGGGAPLSGRSSTRSVGGGGGGGAYAQSSISTQNFHIQPFTVSVGNGGAASAAAGEDGNPSTVVFNTITLVKADGGKGGKYNTTTSINTAITADGGLGGSAENSIGNSLHSGGDGDTGYNSSNNRIGGKGGDAAETEETGGSEVTCDSQESAAGNQGNRPGGGGSGAINRYTTTARNGGAGAPGQVCLTYEILELQLTTNVNYNNSESTSTLVLYYDTVPVSNPTRSEYVFAGWYDAPTGGNKVEFEKSGDVYLYNYNEDLNLYAHWKIDSGAISGSAEILPCGTFATVNDRSATPGSTYKWFYTKDSEIEKHFVAGAAGETLSQDNIPLKDFGTYTFHRVALNAETGDSLVSAGTFTVTVRNVKGGTIQASRSEIYPGQEYSISSVTKDAEVTNYRWAYKNVDSTSYTQIAGATADALSEAQSPALLSEGTYNFIRYTYMDSRCTGSEIEASSDTVSIRVKINPGAISGNTAIYPCGEFSIASETDAQGYDHYMWRYRKGNGNWAAIEGHTEAALPEGVIILNEPGTYSFERLVVGLDDQDTATSGIFTLTVNPVSGGTIAATPATIAPFGSYTITGDDQGTQYAYSWGYRKTGDGDYRTIAGTDYELTSCPALSIGTYEFIRYTSIPECGCQAGTATCTLVVEVPSDKVCFETPGDTIWTAPEGTWKVTAEAWGGGGGGGSAPGQYQGSGGGGGAYAIAALVTSQNFHGGTILISVGQGGAAEQPGGASIMNFNGIDVVNAGGGGAGSYANNRNSAQGGAAGVVVVGSNGGYSATSGQNKQSSSYTSGAGGNGANGGAGGAGRGSQDDGDGHPGSPFGGGGGGARNANDNTNYIGGAGGDGQVCLTYEILTLQLTADVNHDNIEPTSKYILYYDTLILPNPTREGYVFAGWYDAPTGGSPVSFDSIGDYALYNYTEDLVLYAYWKVDPGAIGENESRQYLCSGDLRYTIGGSTVAGNVTYSWQCTRWSESEPANTSDTSVISVNKATLSNEDYPITEPGLYVFNRYVDSQDDDFGPQLSANAYMIYVVVPSDAVEGLTSNYGKICEGGKITLTSDTSRAAITIPHPEDPTRDTTLAAKDISYEYRVNEESPWVAYDPGSTEFVQGTPQFRAVFSYQSSLCKAYSSPVSVTVVKDPVFRSGPSLDVERVCPNGAVTLTANELDGVDFDTAAYPIHYTWKVYDWLENSHIDVGDEATYEYEDANRAIAHVSNFVLPGNTYFYGDDYYSISYIVVAENELGCDANSYDITDDGLGVYGDAYLFVENVVAPNITIEPHCPQVGGTFNMMENVNDDDKGNLLWYADFTTNEALEGDIESTLTYSLADEDTIVWYVAIAGVEGCNSARVPDSLLIRYTSHLYLTSDQSSLTQEVCQFTDIDTITFTYDGNSEPELSGQLPAGLTAELNRSAHTYTISGKPTEDGDYEFDVRLQNTGDCPQTVSFHCVFKVNYSPRSTVYFTSCNHESITIGQGNEAKKFDRPGTYEVRLSSSFDCDSVVTLIYNDYDFNQFGYEEDSTLLAGWSDFRTVTSPINATMSGALYNNYSQISYSDWNYSWSYNIWIITLHSLTCNIASGTNFVGGNNSSLSLPSAGAVGESDETAGTSNGKSIVLKTRTKDYGQLSLQMDYQTRGGQYSNQSLSIVTIEYSTDNQNWSGTGIEVQEMPKPEEQGTMQGTIHVSNLPMAMDDQEVLYIRLTFDGAATAVQQWSENTPLLLDNIKISGHKGIKDVKLVKYPESVCKDQFAEIVASAPYIECDEEEIICDTAVVYYHWTKTVGGTTTELEELGNTLVVPITETATYTVTVGTQESCQSSASCDVLLSEPIDRYDIIREQSWCANDLYNFVFFDSVSGNEVEGTRILYPSIDSLSKAPGVYDCRLSIPIDPEIACDSIIHLQLTVLKSYDTTIYAAICLGDAYEAYGFNVSPDSVGSYTFINEGQCSTGCDSVVTLHLTVNSVAHTLTNYYDVLMAAWPLNDGPRRLTPKCGEESVMRSADLTFAGPNGFKVVDLEEGSTTENTNVCPADNNRALSLYNGIGKSHWALENEAWTSLEGTSVLVKINPTDYEPLKLSFDYNKSIDPAKSEFTTVENAFKSVSCYYSFGDDNYELLGSAVELPSGQTVNNKTQWSTVEFDLTPLHTLDATELDIKLVFTGGQKGAGESHEYARGYVRYRYTPALLNIDNLIITGDKPARAKLFAGLPYAEYFALGDYTQTRANYGDTVNICKDMQITFTSQRKDEYFNFFLRKPDNTEIPFNDRTTMQLVPPETGFYNIIARDNNGCDSVFTFYVQVNEYPVISDYLEFAGPYICTDAPLAFAPVDDAPNITYSWDIPSSDHIEFIDDATLLRGDDQDSLRVRLVNLDTNTIDLRYTVTPKMGGCLGRDFKVDVHVFPQAKITNITDPDQFDGCPNSERTLQLQLEYLKTTGFRYLVWDFNNNKPDTTRGQQATTEFYQNTITLPASPCDTSYEVYATYVDSAGCIAKDTITLTVNIPAHSFTFAVADKDSTVYCLADATVPSTLVPEAYSGCGDTLKGVLVGYVDDPTAITCSGTRTYTYKYTDCKGQDTTWQYVYIISHKAPELKPDSLWPADREGQDNLYANRDTSVLYSDDQVKALYQDNCGGDALTVTHIQVDSSTDNSGWKTTRIYTIVTGCQDTLMPKPTMSVSGSDQTPPTPPTEGDGPQPITGVNSCMDAAYTAKPFNANHAATGYSDAGGFVRAVKTDSAITGTNCGWTITYTYKVVDDYGNELTGQTYTVSGSDQDVPQLTGTWPTHGEENLNASTAEIPAGPTIDVVADLYTDCSTITVERDSVVTGTDCNWRAVFHYTIKDECNNAVQDSVVYTGGDRIKPTYTHPKDTTVYLSRTGEVDTNASRLGVPTNVLDNSGKTPTVSHIDNKTDSCGISYSFDRTWHVKDSCGNDSVFVQKITVADTITPKVTTAAAVAEAFRTIDGAYNLPAAFNTIDAAGVTVSGINIDPELEMTKIDTLNKNTCGLYVVRTYQVKDTCNNQTATFTHQIIVKDTLTPRINGNWADSTVFLTAYNACGYTLPDTLKTVAEVNALKADFIKGQNLNPAITMTDQVVDSGACGTTFYFLRTYTVTDTCSGESKTFTHKISVSDTTKPVLTGTWPADIEGQNHIYAEADTSDLLSDAAVKDLFNDCHDITVTHTQAPTLVSNCGWTIVRTYHIEDACLNGFDSTMSVSGYNQNAPMAFVGTWPSNVTGQNNCLANADTSAFLTDAEAAARFTDTCGVYVTHKDSLDINHNNDCDWTWIRTYSIKDSCDNYVTPAPTMTISGSDQSAPTLIPEGTWPENRDNINANIADIPAGPTKDVIKGLFTDCSTINVDSSRVVSGTDCDWRAVFHYTIKDGCDNAVKDSVIYTGGDNEAPTYVRPNDTTLYLTENGVVDTAAAHLAQPTAVRDNYTPHPTITYVNKEKTNVCGNTYKFQRVWRVTDVCGNVSSNDSVQTITVADTITPRISGTAQNDTVYLALDGTYQLPAAFTQHSQATGITVAGNNISDEIEVEGEAIPTGEGTCGLQVTRTYKVTDTCNVKSNLFTHTIVVKDTLSPRINGNWEDSTVYVSTTGCDYTLPTAFTSVEQVNELSTGFISGINLKNQFEESDIVENEFGANTCNHYVVRTYTVTDSCSQKTNTFSHKIWIKDTVAPTLTDTWNSELEQQSGCSSNADTTKFYEDEYVKGLFTDNCNDVIVSHTQEFQATGNCEWKFTRTYTISDSCGNSRTMVQTLPGTATGEHNAPQLNGPWTDTLPAQNACFAQADRHALYDEAQVKALCTDACSFEVTVTFEDETISSDNCGWSIKRTYTICNDCGDTIYPKPTLTLSGSDQSAPVLAGTWTSTVEGLQNNCLDDADLSELLTDEEVKDLFEDCNENFTVTHTDAATGTDANWTITRTYTVKDACGNTTTPAPTMSVSGKDQTAPVLTGVWPENITETNSCFADVEIDTLLPTNEQVAALYEDNCGGAVTVTSQDSVASASNRGWEVVRTYTIKDANGNETTNTMSVSGSDQSAPVLAENAEWPENITNVNFCSAAADTTQLKSDDDIKALYTDCSDVIVTHTQTLTENDCDWTYTRTYTIADSCGNVAETRTMSMSGQATGETTTPELKPDVSWPIDITGQGNCLANADTSGLLTDSAAAALYKDACSGIIHVTHSDVTTGNNRGWTITRTYTIANGCGGSTTKTMSVSGKDNSAPARTEDQWPGNITNQNGCIASADRTLFPTVDSIKSLYTDCTPITVTFDEVDNPTAATGWTITRTYHVTDSCGNSVSPSPVVTMSGSDQSAPVLSADGTWPENITGQDNLFANADKTELYGEQAVADLYQDCDTVIVSFTDENTLTDNCGWTITRTYTVKDRAGNVVTPAPTMSVSGSDQTPPALIRADGWFPNITGVEGCPSTADTSGLKSNAEVALKFNDNSGSRVTVSHIQETLADEDGEGCAWEIRRTYTIADACGNETTKTMSIFGTMTGENAAPTLAGEWPDVNITNQNNCLDNADTSALYSNVQAAALFTNGCSGVVVSHTDDTTTNGNVWTITRTFTVKDVCGNEATRTYTMSVSGSDQTAPTLAGNWPDDITGQDNCLGNADVTGLLSNEGIQALYDDCSTPIDVTYDDDTTITPNVGWTITRTYTVKDAAGNAVTPAPTMSVSGSDQTAPVLAHEWPSNRQGVNSCKPSDFTTLNLESDQTIAALFEDCSNVVVTSSDAVTGTNCDWTVTRTYTIKDTCGNTVAGTHTMSVSGGNTTTPTYTKPNDTTLYLAEGCLVNTDPSVTLSPTSVVGYCSSEDMVVTYRDEAPVTTCGAGYTFNRIWHVVDACGNVSISDSVQKIIVEDTTRPVLAGTWPRDVMTQNALLSGADMTKFKTDSYVKTLFSDCSDLTVTHKDDTLSDNNCGWEIQRTYTITDACNNETTATMSIGGSDQTKPTFTRPKDTVLYLSADCTVDTTYDSMSKPTDVTDNSDVTPTVTYRNANITANCGKAFEFDRIWRVVDECGNVSISDSVQHITVKDTTKPTFTLPNDTVLYLSAEGTADTTYNSMSKPTDVKDNCTETPMVTYRDANITTLCGKAYKFDRIWRVVDECGNVSISDSVQKITVMDTTRPTFTRPADYITYKDANCLADTSKSSAGVPTNVKDNCTETPTVTYRDETMEHDCGSTYHFNRIWRVVDECGNVSISDSVQKITVKDTTRPTFILPNDTTLYLSAEGTADTTYNSMSKPTDVKDNCTETPMVTYRDANITTLCGNTFEFDRIWRVVDECGNVSIKDSVQHITVNDTIRPTINGTHPQVYTENTNYSVNTFTNGLTNWDVTATDNNAGNSITISYELTGATIGSGNTSLQNVVFNTGKTTVTWTVKDVCGNDTTCTDTIKIINTNQINVYISEKTDTVTYDGHEHTLTGYIVDSIDYSDYQPTYFRLKESSMNDSIVKGTLAGSYSMELIPDDFEKVNPYYSNVTFHVADRNLVIKQNPSPITIASGSHTFEYNHGQPHQFPSYVVTFDGTTMPRTEEDSTKFVLTTGDTLSITPTGSVSSYADTQEGNNTFTYELQNASSYSGTITPTCGTIEVPAYTQPLEIASASQTWTYDGNAHSYPKYTVKFDNFEVEHLLNDSTTFELPTGDTLRIQSPASITNAGKVANTFTYTIDNDEIYVGTRDTIIDTLYVLPLGGVEVTITENTDTVTYDGNPHSVTGYEVTHISSNLYQVADFTYNGQVDDTTASGTYAGTYPMNVQSGQFENQNSNFLGVTFTIVDQDLVIKPIESNIQIMAKSAEKNYDGTPLTEPGYTHTMTGALVAGDTIVATVAGYQTEVGSSANVVTAYYVLRKTSPTTFDTITHCYTFADPATVNGTLLVNNALAIVSKDSVDVDCYGNHNGTATIVVEGGKLVNDKYEYTVAGPNSYSVIDSIGTTLELTGLYPGRYTVTFKDGLDSTVTTTFTIKQPDTLVAKITAPNALCPNQGSYPVSVTVTGGNGTNAYVWGSNATNVNETSTVVAQIGASDCGTEYTAAVQVTDAKGCVAKDTVKFKVVDNEAPSFTVPADITIYKDASCNYDASVAVTGDVTDEADNCSTGIEATYTDVDVTPATACQGTTVIERTWHLVDSCGNAAADQVQTITVEDSIAPTFTRPADITIYKDASGNYYASVAVTGDVTDEADNCSTGIEATFTDVDVTPAGACEGMVVIERTWHLVDKCGNAAADQVQTITVEDNIAPTFTRPADITIYKDASCNYDASVAVTGDVTDEADNSSTDIEATYTDADVTPATACQGTTVIERTWHLVDNCGNAAADQVQTITVEDKIAPSFTAPADITICRNANGEIEAPTTVTGVPTNHSDNCTSVATLVNNTQWVDLDTTGNVNALMVIRRQWTVTDDCGNSVADTQRISIKPSIAGSAYVLTAPADIEVTLRYGAVDTLIANIGQATASHIPEGIAAPQITNNKPANNRYPEGINYVVWTATDECGFTVVDTQTITVKYPPCESVTYYGHEYPAVRLAGNCWLAENLRNTQYADSAAVPNYSSYNNDNNLIADYGLLYSWYSAVRVQEGDDNAAPSATENGYVQGLCPVGWAIPKQSDFASLYTTVGTTEVLRDLNVQYWLPGAAGIAPNAGFNARGAGYYDASVDRYMNMLGEAYFWTSTNTTVESYCVTAGIKYFCSQMLFENQDKGAGFSVRCIRRQ